MFSYFSSFQSNTRVKSTGSVSEVYNTIGVLSTHHSKNAFTIPNIQRIAKFACRSPRETAQLAYVNSIFEETMKSYHTFHTILSNALGTCDLRFYEESCRKSSVSYEKQFEDDENDINDLIGGYYEDEGAPKIVVSQISVGVMRLILDFRFFVRSCLRFNTNEEGNSSSPISKIPWIQDEINLDVLPEYQEALKKKWIYRLRHGDHRSVLENAFALFGTNRRSDDDHSRASIDRLMAIIASDDEADIDWKAHETGGAYHLFRELLSQAERIPVQAQPLTSSGNSKVQECRTRLVNLYHVYFEFVPWVPKEIWYNLIEDADRVGFVDGQNLFRHCCREAALVAADPSSTFDDLLRVPDGHLFDRLIYFLSLLPREHLPREVDPLTSNHPLNLAKMEGRKLLLRCFSLPAPFGESLYEDVFSMLEDLDMSTAALAYRDPKTGFNALMMCCQKAEFAILELMVEFVRFSRPSLCCTNHDQTQSIITLFMERYFLSNNHDNNDNNNDNDPNRLQRERNLRYIRTEFLNDEIIPMFPTPFHLLYVPLRLDISEDNDDRANVFTHALRQSLMWVIAWVRRLGNLPMGFLLGRGISGMIFYSCVGFLALSCSVMVAYAEIDHFVSVGFFGFERDWLGGDDLPGPFGFFEADLFGYCRAIIWVLLFPPRFLLRRVLDFVFLAAISFVICLVLSLTLILILTPVALVVCWGLLTNHLMVGHRKRPDQRRREVDDD